MTLPPLYAIADIGSLRARGIALEAWAEAMRAGGVLLVQLRNKEGAPREILEQAAMLRRVFAGTGCQFIMNDRVDLAVLAGFDGVHVGQGDLSTADARAVLGPTGIVGVSTHTDEQVRLADASVADYIAVGPVFATSTKADAEPVIGLQGVQRLRALTRKPLVAIGGITAGNAESVRQHGADSVAVISALLGTVEEMAETVIKLTTRPSS